MGRKVFFIWGGEALWSDEEKESNFSIIFCTVKNFLWNRKNLDVATTWKIFRANVLRFVKTSSLRYFSFTVNFTLASSKFALNNQIVLNI